MTSKYTKLNGTMNGTMNGEPINSPLAWQPTASTKQ